MIDNPNVLSQQNPNMPQIGISNLGGAGPNPRSLSNALN